MTAFVPVKETWRDLDEVKIGERRSWFTGTEERQQRPWYERWCGSILKAGALPKHVAFIMDGNRRYAKRKEVSRAAGHLAGFERLATVLESCLDMGITEVTVYAFSIENFNRSQEEVECLFDLCREKFRVLLEGRQQQLLMEHQVCVRIIGDITMLPKDLQKMLARVVLNTRHNARAVLNVCLAYTSRNDMASAVRACAKGVADGLLVPSDVTDDVIERTMMTNQMPDLDMLLRTSGEVRLSDFLLWESSHSCLVFEEVLWPDFSIWDLYKAILMFQRHNVTIDATKEDSRRLSLECARALDREEALKLFRADMPPEGWAQDAEPDPSLLKSMTNDVRKKRTLRVNAFLTKVESDRFKLLQDIVAEN